VATINPASPSESPNENTSVLMKSLAQRFIELPPWGGPGVTAFVGQFPQILFWSGIDDSSRTNLPEGAGAG
jgi:hypothetical protein